MRLGVIMSARSRGYFVKTKVDPLYIADQMITCGTCLADIMLSDAYHNQVRGRSLCYSCKDCVDFYYKVFAYYRSARYRAKKQQATPKWVSAVSLAVIYKRAKEISEETGVPHHVDHIVPLNSKLVCGLHVPANLQIIPWYENVRKGNKFDGQKSATPKKLYLLDTEPKKPRLIKKQNQPSSVPVRGSE